MQTILLSDDEARSFLEWRRNQDTWEIMRKAGIFGITNGSAEIHFDWQGRIGLIDTHLAVFRRVKAKLSTGPLQSQGNIS